MIARHASSMNMNRTVTLAPRLTRKIAMIVARAARMAPNMFGFKLGQMPLR